MKTILPALFLLFASNAFSTVLTVSQDADLPAQFNNINTAIGAAAVDDTIYIHGTATWYNYNMQLNKRLVIIGPGHRPRTPSGYGAFVNNIELFAGCNGSAIYGMGTFLIQKIGGAQLDTVNLTIKNCRFASGGVGGINCAFSFTNFIVENCVFESGGIGFNWGGPFNRTGAVISNNIFTTFAVTGGASISEPRSNFIIDHNLFICTATNIRAISGGQNCIISNNIFFGRTIDTTGGFNIGVNCVMNNNITYLCTNTLPTPGNSGSNNINADPQFVNFPATASPFSYSHDYHLGITSPGKNAATDGTDIGIYGNNVEFSMTGEYDELPFLRIVDIYNTTIPPGGMLNVQLKASVPVKN